MSTESRLKRLGLWHLRDKPDELQRELDRRIKEYDADVERWHRERDKIRAARALENELVQGIFEDPDDRENWLVYADWLSEHERRKGPLVAQDLEDPEPVYAVLESRGWAFTWRNGFVRTANYNGIERSVDEQAGDVELFCTLEDTRFVCELSVELHAGDAGDERGAVLLRILEPVVRTLGISRWESARKLRLGLPDNDVRWSGYAYTDAAAGVDGRGMFTYVKPDTAQQLWLAVPRLERLSVFGHFLFPNIEHPTLQALAVGGCSPIMSIGANWYEGNPNPILPALQRLHCTCVNDGAGGVLTPDLLAFDKDVYPALTHLDLGDSYPFEVALHGDDEAVTLLDAAAGWEVLPQLETLTLPSFGTYRDEHGGVAAIDIVARCADAFRHLKTLTIRELEDDLSEDEVEALLPNLEIEDITPWAQVR